MTAIPILSPKVHDWRCPSCGLTNRTLSPEAVWHPCPALKGLNAPMVPFATSAKHVVQEREDYEGKDIAQRDSDGKVVMSILTIRDDGQDCTVLAPTATATFS